MSIGYPSYEGTPLTNLTWVGPTNTSEWDELFGKIVYLDPPYTRYGMPLAHAYVRLLYLRMFHVNDMYFDMNRRICSWGKEQRGAGLGSIDWRFMVYW